MKSKTLVALMLGLGLVFVLNAAYAGAALDLLKSQETVVRKILAKPTVPKTPEHVAKENELRKTINQLFDFQELGKRALVDHWAGLNEAQHKEFVDLLQRLIERNYLLKITKATTFTLLWFPEVKSPEFLTERFKIKSNKYKASIQLKMMQKAGKWVVFDMVIDDVSLLENYKSQFNKIISEKGFERLLKKMRKKLVELEKDDTKSGDLDKASAIKPKKKAADNDD